MQKVYLAGGMRSEWRNTVKMGCNNIIFLCPVEKEQSRDMTLEEYGVWDLHHIKQSDIVFGFMERANPSGIGLACEAGYAYGLGKTVILVLEEPNEHIDSRYLAFLRKVAHITFPTLSEGIEYLSLF